MSTLPSDTLCALSLTLKQSSARTSKEKDRYQHFIAAGNLTLGLLEKVTINTKEQKPNAGLHFMAHYNRVMNSKHGEFTAQRKPDVVMAFDEITTTLYKPRPLGFKQTHLQKLQTLPDKALPWVDCMSILEFKRTDAILSPPRGWKGDLPQSLSQGRVIEGKKLCEQTNQVLAAEKVEADKEDQKYAEEKQGKATSESAGNADPSTPGE